MVTSQGPWTKGFYVKIFHCKKSSYRLSKSISWWVVLTDFGKKLCYTVAFFRFGRELCFTVAFFLYYNIAGPRIIFDFKPADICHHIQA